MNIHTSLIVPSLCLVCAGWQQAGKVSLGFCIPWQLVQGGPQLSSSHMWARISLGPVFGSQFSELCASVSFLFIFQKLTVFPGEKPISHIKIRERDTSEHELWCLRTLCVWMCKAKSVFSAVSKIFTKDYPSCTSLNLYQYRSRKLWLESLEF